MIHVHEDDNIDIDIRVKLKLDDDSLSMSNSSLAKRKPPRGQVCFCRWSGLRKWSEPNMCRPALIYIQWFSRLLARLVSVDRTNEGESLLGTNTMAKQRAIYRAHFADKNNNNNNNRSHCVC